MVRGFNLSNMVIKMNFFIRNNVLYYDAFKRKLASDEIVVTDELLRKLGIESPIIQIKEMVRDRLQIK